jgi:hypothetical protein
MQNPATGRTRGSDGIVLWVIVGGIVLAVITFVATRFYLSAMTRDRLSRWPLVALLAAMGCASAIVVQFVRTRGNFSYPLAIVAFGLFMVAARWMDLEVRGAPNRSDPPVA